MGYVHVEADEPQKPFKEPGNSLEGKYMGGEPSTFGHLHTLQVSDAEFIPFFATGLLDRLLMKVRAGDRIKITFTEIVKTKAKRGFHVYTVEKWVEDAESADPGVSGEPAPVDDIELAQDSSKPAPDDDIPF